LGNGPSHGERRPRVQTAGAPTRICCDTVRALIQVPPPSGRLGPLEPGMHQHRSHLFFYIWFLGRPEIVEFWGLGGPGGPRNHSRRWGATPPPSGVVFGAAGAAQTSQIDDFPPVPNSCIKNPSVIQSEIERRVVGLGVMALALGEQTECHLLGFGVMVMVLGSESTVMFGFRGHGRQGADVVSCWTFRGPSFGLRGDPSRPAGVQCPREQTKHHIAWLAVLW
jgi:hypothetical protein